MSTKVTIRSRDVLVPIVGALSLLATEADALRRLAVCVDHEAATGDLSQARVDTLRREMNRVSRLCRNTGKSLVSARSLIVATPMKEGER